MSVIPFRRRKIPYRFFNANFIIIGLNVLVFLVRIVFPDLAQWLVLRPQGLFEQASVWQLFSYHFVNLDIWLLVLNLLGLFFFGGPVEREMGSLEYLIFYFGIGVAAGLFTAGLFGLLGWDVPLFGSTMVLTAVLLAYATLYPDSVVYFMGIVPLRAPVVVLVYLGFIVLGFVLSNAWWGLVDLAGLVFGFAYVLVRYRSNPFKHLFR